MKDCTVISPVERASRPATEGSLDGAKWRIPQNVASNWVSYLINVVVAFLIAPLIVHKLGNLTYGVWGLIGQLVEYSFLLDFGLRIAVTRYVARDLALERPGEINKVVTSGLAVNAISALLTLVCGAGLAWLLPRFFPIPAALVPEARWSVLVLAAGVAISFPGSLFTGCVVASSRYDLLGFRKALPVIVRAGLLWLLLERGCGLLTVAIVSTLAVVLGYALDFVFTLRLFPSLRIGPEFFDRAVLKALISFSAYAFVISIAWRLIFMSDSIVVGAVLGPVAVTFYTVGMSLASTLRDSVGNITMVYAPLAYQMQALNQGDSLRRLLTSGSRIALLYALPGALGLIVLGPRFLGLWMGPSFVKQSGPILMLLAAEVAFYALSFASVQVLYAMERHKANAWLSLANGAVNLGLSLALIRRLGALGVAWGTLIPAFVIEAVVLPSYTARLLRVSLVQFYRSTVVETVVAALPYGLWLWACAHYDLARSYGTFALVLGAGLALYAISAWTMLDAGERALARRWIDRFRSTLATIHPAWGNTAPE